MCIRDSLNREYDELKLYLNNNDYDDLIKIINPIVNEFNDGDLTEIPNVDWFNEYLSMMNESSSVSYTHLDVYKRQGL